MRNHGSAGLEKKIFKDVSLHIKACVILCLHISTLNIIVFDLSIYQFILNTSKQFIMLGTSHFVLIIMQSICIQKTWHVPCLCNIKGENATLIYPVCVSQKGCWSLVLNSVRSSNKGVADAMSVFLLWPLHLVAPDWPVLQASHEIPGSGIWDGLDVPDKHISEVQNDNEGDAYTKDFACTTWTCS